MYARSIAVAMLAALQLGAVSVRAAFGQSALSGEPIHITRAASSMTIDGDVNDEAWRGAVRIDRWYETRPGDNTEPAWRADR